MRGELRNAALWSLLTAFAGAVLIAFQMWEHLVPRPDNRIIWALSVFVLFVGTCRAIADIVRLRREWSALDQLKGRAEPERLAASFAGTAVGERAALVRTAIAERRVDREFRQSNRAEAAASLDSVGSVTRFMGSALLVLAVMGTFAGMKGALPHLQTAIMQASAPGVGNGSSSSIGEALEQVSDAFGANFVALFGSLLLGAAAFGAIMERRRFLSRLEHSSERHLYRLLPADADASELQKAVYELQRSVTSIADIGSAVEGLGSGITELKVVLRDTLSEMHTSFNDSVRRHGVELQSQLNATVSELTGTLSGTTKALETTAVAYEGLVKGLEERDLGLARATAALASGVEQIQEVQAVATAAARDATAVSKQATEITAQVTELGAQAQRTLTVAGTEVARSADKVASTIDMQARRLSEVAARLVELRDEQTSTRQALVDELKALTGETTSGMAAASTAIQERLSALLDGMEAALGTLRADGERLASTLDGNARGRGEAQIAALSGGVARLVSELAASRQGAANDQRAAATYVAAEASRRLDTLAEHLAAVGAAIDAGAASTKAAMDALGQAQRTRSEESERAGARLVTVMEAVHHELALTRRELGTLVQALSERPAARESRPELARGNGAAGRQGA